MEYNYNYVGIDISKDKFDAQWSNHHWEIKQSDKRIMTFLGKLSALIKKSNGYPVLFVCEASGGYERLLTTILRKQGVAYHVAHANKIRAFARSKGYLAKTDKIDAYLIAEYAQVMQVKADEFELSENKLKIADLIKRREQLIQDKQREINRLDKLVDSAVLSSQKAHIKWLEKEIGKIEAQLDSVKEKEDIKAQVDLLSSMPGIGQLSAFYLIAFLPELGSLSHKELSALVGVAPYNRDSGKHQGKRHIYGGRSRIRAILYMAALSAIRWNAGLKTFYQHLIQRGKVAKVAIVAVMRKILSILNSMMRYQTVWVKKEPLFV